MTDQLTGESITAAGAADTTGPVSEAVRIPNIPPGDAEQVAAIGRATLAAAEALCKASAAAQELGLPDPDGIGVVGLDYSALGEVVLSLLVWAGALLEGADAKASKRLIVVTQPRLHLH